MHLVSTPIGVNLIHADDWKSLIKEAWSNSRPNINPDEINYNEVLQIDTPVSEIPGVVLELEIPILFREILVNMRDHVVWARSSRVDSLLDQWNVIDSVTSEDTILLKKLTEQMTTDSETQTQDNYRQNLPLGYMTGLTTRISIRSMFKILKFFDYLSKNYPTVSTAANDLSVKLKDILNTLEIDVEVVSKRIKFQNLVPEYVSPKLGYNKVSSANHTVITALIPISLRAQLIRHRPISVVDNLLDFIKNDQVWSLPISSMIVVEISASNSIWKSLVGKRIGWIAQSDLWSPITDAIISDGNVEDFMMDLSEGYPYAGDNWERIKGTDPGVPDPLHVLELSDEEFKQWITPEMVDRMYQYVIDTNRPGHYWNGIIDQVRSRFN